jgi:hypothetical protein
MSNTQHTPGPWAAEGFDQIYASTGNFYGGLIMGANGEDIVAQCVLPHNARLIAAAPELLEFAEWVLSLKTGGMIEGRARAAIAKATGEKT